MMFEFEPSDSLPYRPNGTRTQQVTLAQRFARFTLLPKSSKSVLHGELIGRSSKEADRPVYRDAASKCLRRFSFARRKSQCSTQSRGRRRVSLIEKREVVDGLKRPPSDSAPRVFSSNSPSLWGASRDELTGREVRALRWRLLRPNCASSRLLNACHRCHPSIL